MNELLETLKSKLATISDLQSALWILSWDQQTYMPAGGIETRAEQMATLSHLAHELSTAPDLGELLEKLNGQLDPETDDGALVRIAYRDYQNDTKLPGDLVARATRAAIMADPAWAKARETNDWSLFAPHLDGLIEIARETASYIDASAHPFDALLSVGEPGMTKAQLEAMYAALKEETVPMIKAISEQHDPQRSAPLFGNFPVDRQKTFGWMVAQQFGFDTQRGRQDLSVHPFCTMFSSDDVRQTTRFEPNWLSPALFGTLHETGHGLYNQGLAKRFNRTPLGHGCSMGIHESQSRLWENLVGRSRAFWEHYYGQLQETFPEQLGGVDLDAFYRAINTVEPSLIRVEADEVTYNLHTLLRFELELDLLEDKLAVHDLPAAWNAKMEAYLGITPPNDSEGVLQDVHWSGGMFAYFPTYTIGNVLSVQFYDAAVQAHPAIPDEIGRGEFGTLLSWLQDNVYQYGRKYDPNDLVERATGRPMDTAPYLKYLKTKFSELYEL